MKDNKHLFVPDMEGAEGKFDYCVGGHDLLIDIKVLLKEYYAATFSDDGSSLLMQFSNGQKFRLRLEEC